MTARSDCTTPPAPAEVVELPDDDTLAALAKAAAHPARIRILRFLAQQCDCITGEIVTELELAQSTVSEHLRILREAGLVRGEIEGPRTRYCLDVDGLRSLTIGIDAIARVRSNPRS